MLKLSSDRLLMKGILYVVATPIGNLEDITLRAIQVLRDVDLVVAEHRGRALALLSHLQIRKPILTINSYNEERKARAIVEQLSRSKNCALISAAGTPCISDPGGILVRKAREEEIDVRAVPGPSAVIAALSIAGVATDRFLFHGFLPQKGGKKRKVLQELLSHPFTVVIYESPRRVKETLIAIADAAPGRLVAVLRELTKVYEEVVRGTIEEVRELVEEADTKGEYVIVIEGQGAVAKGNENTRREDRDARSKAKSARFKDKDSRKRAGRERLEDYD